MVLSNGNYVSLRDTNETVSVILPVNRLRRIERCELECGNSLEIHCLRFDLLLGCASYMSPAVKRQHLVTAHKVYAYMIRSKY